MIRRPSGLLALTLFAIVAAGCGARTESTAPHRTTSTTTKHYVELEAGAVSVTPSSGLQDAQRVTVFVRGFPGSTKFYLSECLSPTAVNPVGCGPQLAAQPFGLAEGDGAGSATFTVHSAASSGALIPTMQPCTGECVIVATNGIDVTLYSEPISFAPPAIPAAHTPACTDQDIAVSDEGGGGAGGHEDQVLVFTNGGGSVCTLTGYPGVAGLNAAGQQEAQAQRSLGGYMGGLSPDTTALPVVSLAPGQTASAIVEATDNPLGSQPCPRFPSLLVTPPNSTRQVQVAVSGLGDQGFPDCSRIEVHPVVAGGGGNSPGF